MAKTKPEPLAEYIARMEREAFPVVLVQISHPDATDGAIHQGPYSGIRLVKGDCRAILSDGTKI